VVTSDANPTIVDDRFIDRVKGVKPSCAAGACRWRLPALYRPGALEHFVDGDLSNAFRPGHLGTHVLATSTGPLTPPTRKRPTAIEISVPFPFATR